MGIREIPKSYEYTCDGCGKPHLQENASGHYTDSRPPHWARLKLARHAYDGGDIAVGDASIERLLCSSCAEKVASAINAAVAPAPSGRRG